MNKDFENTASSSGLSSPRMRGSRSLARFTSTRHWILAFAGMTEGFVPRSKEFFLTSATVILALTASATEFPAFDALPVQTALPDAFTMMDGTKITTAEEWTTKRRPELITLFKHYVYGFAPAAPEIEVSESVPPQSVLDGKGLLKQLTIRFKNLPGENAPRINLALFLPAAATGPVPVFLAPNKCGNYEVLHDPAIQYNPDVWCPDNCPHTDTEGRGANEDYWCVASILERGYAFATYHDSDIDPDKDDFTDGIHAAYAAELPISGDSWGTIAAWSWGLSRCIDYLVTDPAINPAQVAVIGHSRRGKTALLTAALDERVALVVPHQSGTGGMAPSRDNDQETTERINRVFPHWFCNNFAQFDHQEDKLPIDQHLLAALVAPRPLLDTEGLKDTWANGKSSLKGLLLANRVYRLLGAPGIKGGGVIQGPAKLTKENTGNLLQYRLDTVHTLNQDYWNAILDFADIQFGRG